ncbi:MAG TPA: hypothetical protein VIA18_06030, partial [Polyangia bacterium]|nr:hypothetical protein [Polyangia bacterium]
MRVHVAFFIVAACALPGCDEILPALFGSGATDMASTDLAGADLSGDLGVVRELQGQVCVVTDVRDYRSCAVGTFAADLRITVEETRDEATTDLAGAFTLPLTATITTATVAVVDTTGKYQTTIVPLALTNGARTDIALPLIPAASVAAMAANEEATLDPNRGQALVWAVDEVGLPVAGVSANTTMLADGSDANVLVAASATGSRGAIGIVNTLVPTLNLTLTSAATSSVV